MLVPKHSASVQDSLRHRGYRQSSASLQQAQVLEGEEAQIQGRIHRNSIIPVWTGTGSTRTINGLLCLSPSLLQKQTFLMRWVSLLSLSAVLFYTILPPSTLPSSVKSGPFSRPSSVPLLSFLSLLLSPSLSASYSCCHPHRTSQKCADSGCWATLPYYWSFKWNPQRASLWLVSFSAGRGCCNVVWPHEFLYILCSNKYELQGFPCFVSVIMKDRKCGIIWLIKVMEVLHKAQLHLNRLRKFSVMVNRVTHELNYTPNLRYDLHNAEIMWGNWIYRMLNLDQSRVRLH